ncbi:MAG: radical SAM protein [Elusimicrobia bacterium]|nr:radical SAM protein [Elusimicrobiota bacterium]
MADRLPSARLNRLTLERNIPVSATAELTRRCPLSCRHCYLPETRGRARAPRELSAAVWKSIISDLARAGALYLTFTGGEPLLREDLAELCRHAASLRFDVSVFSTGLGLTPALAGELKEAGISSFGISFYGRPELHDRVTGLKGSFRRSLAAARLLRKAGVRVRMKSPLMTLNAEEAGWLTRLSSAEGFAVSFDPVIAPANDGHPGASAFRLSGPALARAVSKVPPPPSTAEAAAGPGADDFICGAGRNVCAVDPSGWLYPCLQLPVRLGNLARSRFSSIWRGSPWLKKWRRLSAADQKSCVKCRDREYCSLCPGISLLEEDDVLAPNSAACEMAAIMRRGAGV